MHITRNFVPAGKLLQQFLRFALVGGMNTIIDIMVFNLLLWLLPSRNIGDLLLYNTIACLVAASNSFLWNKYWTFKQRQPITRKELLHFALLTAATVLCNNCIVLILTNSLPSLMASAALGANILRLSAIAGTLFISFFGMRERLLQILHGLNNRMHCYANHSIVSPLYSPPTMRRPQSLRRFKRQ